MMRNINFFSQLFIATVCWMLLALVGLTQGNEIISNQGAYKAFASSIFGAPNGAKLGSYTTPPKSGYPAAYSNDLNGYDYGLSPYNRNNALPYSSSYNGGQYNAYPYGYGSNSAMGYSSGLPYGNHALGGDSGYPGYAGPGYPGYADPGYRYPDYKAPGYGVFPPPVPNILYPGQYSRSNGVVPLPSAYPGISAAVQGKEGFLRHQYLPV